MPEQESQKSRARRPDTGHQELVVEVVSRHSEGLLRLARRHSLCASDAEDAYQRGLEIFIRHAPRLDPDRAPSWLRTVVKHEAMAVRRARQRDLAPAEYDFDAVEAVGTAAPDDQVAGFERVARSAEALGTLKPQEVRALWLRAQGNSYDEIQAQTGWTRTKVNRCLYEGRRAFLSRYAGIEAGEECRRWEPVLSALADGEAGHEDLVAVRPHLRSCAGCRATVREIHRSSRPLAVLFPAGAILAEGPGAEEAAHLVARTWEAVSAWMAERAAATVLRAQSLLEALVASAGKGTAVVAAGAAIASGSTVVMQEAGPDPAGGSASKPGDAGVVRVADAALGEARREARRRQRQADARAREAAAREARAVAAPSRPSPASSPAASTPAGPAAAAPAPAQAPEPASSGAEFGLE